MEKKTENCLEVKKWQDEEALRRYQMIAPLLDPEMDEGKRQQMREEAAERNGVSKRTLYRYEKGYREEGFDGLRPAGRTKKRQQRLPENFERIMEQAVQLKREVPKRSVRQVIKILEDLNRRWKVFLEQEYQKEAHAGIKEYYESCGASVPACGITPEQEWMRDSRGLIFMDISTVAEAFLHRERRRIDEAGCFSLSGSRYEASAALANLEVEVAYDPMDMEPVTVYCRGALPLTAHRLEIGAFASKVPPVPVGMMGSIPETSRLLDALEKKYKEDHGQMARALSFGEYGKEAGRHV